jgi:hypothetical protein
VLIAASTAEVLIPAVFGLVGAIIGALISWAAAVSQRRKDKDDDVRIAWLRFVNALNELRGKPADEGARRAYTRLVELGFTAMSAGIDLRLAHGAMRYGGDMINRYDMAEHMRVDPLQYAQEQGAQLIAAVNTVRYWRRRGPFMDPDIRRRAEKYARLDESYLRIREQPHTGPLWTLGRLLDRLHQRRHSDEEPLGPESP